MRPTDAGRIARSVDSVQTALFGAVWAQLLKAQLVSDSLVLLGRIKSRGLILFTEKSKDFSNTNVPHFSG